MGIERRDAALHGCLESLPDSYFHCIAANLKAQTSQGQRTAFHEIASETVQEGDAGFQPLHLFLALGEWGRLCLAQSGHHPGGAGERDLVLGAVRSWASPFPHWHQSQALL